MNVESIKSVILTVLVLLSVLLTWSIWTYQPKLDQIEQTQYMEVAISKQEPESIVRPTQILYHHDTHYGTSDEKEIEKTMVEILKWNLDDIKDISQSIPDRDFLNFVHGKGKTEIKFSGKVPLGIYKKIIRINEKVVPEFKFDRIVINTLKGQDSLYFVAYNEKKVFRANVNVSLLESFKKDFYTNAHRYPKYESFKLTDSKMLFLPKELDKFLPYKYYPIDRGKKEKFRDALFSDPSIVKQDYLPQVEKEVYTDGSSLMKVNYNTMMIEYINPTKGKNIPSQSDDLLQKSIDFVNDHAGWEDDYRFAELSEAEQKTVFRLFLEGLPVFNEDGMSEIVQVWSKDEISQYTRPYYSLGFPLPSEIKDNVLPTGKEAFEEVASMRNFDRNLLDDLVVGYKLSRDPLEQKIISLEPAWYYRYDGAWNRVIFPKRGGALNGLE
ncbi:YycH family regulatory protein [Peribacillus alkalitolerans]|uniref:YycH family regulatory protein n=1 Tax=Peribacillus alkalitolerans TaxID=1550385 RepID=UPI0013D0B160|nr:two-component system activity regulator YycH [Peribacillus alkalitolerans]